MQLIHRGSHILGQSTHYENIPNWVHSLSVCTWYGNIPIRNIPVYCRNTPDQVHPRSVNTRYVNIPDWEYPCVASNIMRTP